VRLQNTHIFDSLGIGPANDIHIRYHNSAIIHSHK